MRTLNRLLLVGYAATHFPIERIAQRLGAARRSDCFTEDGLIDPSTRVTTDQVQPRAVPGNDCSKDAIPMCLGKWGCLWTPPQKLWKVRFI